MKKLREKKEKKIRKRGADFVLVGPPIGCCMLCVVYFDQLSGAHSTRKLVEIHNSYVFNVFIVL